MNEVLTEEPQRPAIAREVADSTGFLLATLGIGCKALAVTRFAQTGGELYDYSVLALLNEGARTAQAAIAEALMLDPSRLVALLDSLEARGLVTRQRDPHDRRRHVVTITPAGRDELVKLRAIVHDFEEEFLAPLSAADRATLHQLLVALAAHNDPRCCPFDERELKKLLGEYA